MGQLGTKMRWLGTGDGYTVGGLAHWCPACQEMHHFAIEGYNSSGAKWTWDGNVESPSFTPSMNIRTNPPSDPHYQPDVSSSVCHYFLRSGRIMYLGDCTHSMKDQTVPLPELPEHMRDREAINV